MKRAISVIMQLLLLTSLLTSMFNVTSVKAEAIGTTIQAVPFESNPSSYMRSITALPVTSPALMWDGDLLTYGYFRLFTPSTPTPLTAWFQLSGFSVPASPTFDPGWVEVKMKYAFLSPTIDDSYRIEYTVGAAAWRTLVADVSGSGSLFELAIRPWSQLVEPNTDSVTGWSWNDISNLKVRFFLTKGGAYWDGDIMFIYELWASVHPLPLPPTSSTTISVQPPTVMSIPVSNILFVEVYVNNVTDLFGWQFVLRFDTIILTPTEAFAYWPWTDSLVQTLDDEGGFVELAYSMPPPVPIGEAFTGNSPIARIYFTVDSTYSRRNGEFDISDDPFETILGDSQGVRIRAVIYDGFFSVPIYLSAEPPTIIDFANPSATRWRELYPQYSLMWNLTSWEDSNGDLVLSSSDQVGMINETGWKYWFNVDQVTVAIHWTFQPPDVGTGAAESEIPMPELPVDPWFTRWHQISPNFSRMFTITDWLDVDGDGIFSQSDQFSFEYDDEPGVPHWAFLDAASTEILVSQKPIPPELQARMYGPQMDSLYIKYYESTDALYNALKNGEVDLTDMILTKAQTDEVFNNTNIQAAITPAFSIFEFDLNNNATTPTYPNWPNPTAYKEFRQGIAYLVNKTRIVYDILKYSYRIDTPVPRPTGDWWVDWAVSQYDPYGNLLGNYPYEYDPNKAADCFNSIGFYPGNITNPYYDPSFPSSSYYLRWYPGGHPKAGQPLDPLIFYIRSDDPRRLEIGRILRDNLRKMGIPVNPIETGSGTAYTKVILQRDYHIYTAGWAESGESSWNAVSFLSVYVSDYSYNYVQFRNATYDDLVRKVEAPTNLTLSREAAEKAQRILVEEAASVWLWSPSWVMGYRSLYGIVNPRGSRIDNRWTFLRARNDARTEIYYGLQSPPVSLNVVTDYLPGWPSPETDSLNRIYDTLLSYSPFDKTPGNVYGADEDRGELMPWMAEDWQLGEWESPYDPAKNLTKLTFYLRDGIKWHDGVPLNSTDVKFTIEYVQGLGNQSSLYGSVSDVHHVTIPNDRTVVVYENVSNIRTLETIGTLPMLPKHIFQSISNVTGYTPGTAQGYPANLAMIGSGAWKYVSHNSTTLTLEANPDYFMETPPLNEIDFRYNWEMGSWIVDTMDAAMLGEAYGTSGNLVPQTKWDPGSDLNGDGRADLFDVIVFGQGFNATWGGSAKRYIAQPPTETSVYIEHSANPILVGQNLTVYVKLFTYNLTKLSGLQFKLNYDNTKLNALDLTVTQIFGTSTLEIRKNINQTSGFIWVSISSLGPSSPISGYTTVATITFNATQPSGSMLDLWNTELASYGPPGLTSQPVSHKSIDKSVTVGISTPTGTNVTIAPAPNANVTFESVDAEGVTTLNITQPPSPEFVSVVCVEIKTNATYTGNVTIQFVYDPTGLSLQDEQSLKIWLWNASSLNWIDITIYVDTTNNIIYGESPHLSIFGITSDLFVEGNFSEWGEITVRIPSSPPNPPEGLALLKSYEISTTKFYTGDIIIRMAYDDNSIPAGTESFIQIWRWNEPSAVWVDITASVDTVNNIVYGVTAQLSIFGITGLPQPPPRVVVVSSRFSKTVVGQGFKASIELTVENQGDFTQRNFDVAVYGNSMEIATYQIAELSPSTQTTISVTWDTPGWSKGSYAISSLGTVIKSVILAMPCDVAGSTVTPPAPPDGRVNYIDVFWLLKAYNSDPTKPNWDWNTNLDFAGSTTTPPALPDDRVNYIDVFWLLKNYGKTDTP